MPLARQFWSCPSGHLRRGSRVGARRVVNASATRPLTHDVNDLCADAKALIARISAGESGISVGGVSGGRATAGGPTSPVFDPSNGTVLTEAPVGSTEDIDNAVFAARNAFYSWKAQPPSKRSALLHKLADLIDLHSEELAQLEALDVGKPVSVARNADIPSAGSALRYFASLAMVSPGGSGEVAVPISRPTPSSHSYTIRTPVGVVGAITPWNFPLVLAVHKCGSALAAGCTVVLKPPEQAPLTSIRLGELAIEAGFPPGVLNVVPGEGEPTGAHLASHPGVDAISFTGSTQVGRRIVQAAASSNLNRVSLELGGKSPHIIFGDADVDAAIASAASGVFFNSGQVCCAGTRILVERSVVDRVVNGLHDESAKLVLGAALNERSTFGPLVSAEQLESATKLIEAGEESGEVELAFGGVGAALESPGYYMSPTVLVSAEADPLENPAWKNEIFGPVGIVQSFDRGDDLEAIAAMANDTNYGLASGIWTHDVTTAHALASLLDAGSVWINGYAAMDAALPFGGFKESGWGREMGRNALDEFTEIKTVTIAL